MLKIKTNQTIDIKQNNLDVLGLKRIWISHVYPEIDGGQFPAKRIIKDTVIIEADIFCDGIDEINAVLLYKHEADNDWQQTYFSPANNDRMQAIFKAAKLGYYTYTIKAWVDEFGTWKKRFLKKVKLKDDIKVEKLIGAELLKRSCHENTSPIVDLTLEKLATLNQPAQLEKLLNNKKLISWIQSQLKPTFVTVYPKELTIIVEREKARFSTWYELFPRSVTTDPTKHGTFKNVINHLPIVKKMGFDVIYMPPIHPIGETNRKGKNNSLVATENDPGSPWGIGSSKGGHKSVHPELGTLEDFRQVVKKAKELDMEIALDFALQCSPDHPYLKKNSNWFKHRPDGTLQYAENPPKKYQDIYPIDFASSDWPAMWDEFKSIILFWIKQGVKIFRVDNPHTKPFIFWQWLIKEVKALHPDVLMLSEAFTRPKIMYHLAKCGFSQSYTYFAWRNTKEELTQYLNELNSPPVVDFFRPHFWPNTPDILTELLQKGGRPAFIIRFMLAATLSSNYGIYGPAYENCINEPLHKGSEEYANSEKYAIYHWQKTKDNISDIITQVNAIRHQHEALQNTDSLQFYWTDNPQLICFSKHNASQSNIILVIVNLDYQYKQSGFIDIKFEKFRIEHEPFEIHDLLTDDVYTWRNGRCYVELNPTKDQYAHIFQVRMQ
ncbi:Alpha-1,4-glucan:maltose-1-phosphate maltosyltransferase 2 [Legionella beliardensis]|uniref:Alpha-1,4-glucan:maltose-1-phosphate maltosyltransferase n=1 Tax=Legionella beliardensis TaxID=91822 RepID=A0A378I5V6_9GAMM|nr:alpha-1,4-glucan--maltose-1-phosphate maltosyltransferase [Legionella beliardensis]STX27854.1 Alpha-1,4-glucan:maltose-1-phosphate maltosyltransferase 2 [Legionella beliardensis]